MGMLRTTSGSTQVGILMSIIASGLTVLAFAAPAGATAPGPCGGVAQITDASGDGHHPNTDVLSAWFGESAGQVRAVIKVTTGVWEPAHDDSDAASFSLLFRVGGQTRFVRGIAGRGVPVAYDHGTWTRAGGFVSAGATTAEVTTGPGATITIDVPAATGAVAGAVLADPFVLTTDGEDAPGQPHWVDRAPGGTSPDETAYGADFVVGTCSGGSSSGGTGGTSTGGSGTGSGTGSTGTGSTGTGSGTGTGSTGTGSGSTGPTGTSGITSVLLTAPERVVGSARARLSGRVTPARGGLVVSFRSTVPGVRVPNLVTRPDGTFSGLVSVPRTVGLRAVVSGFGSQTRTIVVRPVVRISVRRLRSGAVVVSGVVRPALPGRVLFLRTSAITPSATRTVVRGRFRIRLTRPVRGRYQALFSPSGDRAERATSNTGVIR